MTELLKLNIGSGYKRYPGYLNVDTDELCQPDIIANLDDPNVKLPYDDNSVSDIRAYHILEHIQHFIPLLKELYRISAPGAIWDVKLPYIRHDVAIIDVTHCRMLVPESFRLFSKKHNKMEIERGGSSSTLGLQNNIDIELISYNFTYDSFYDNILPTLSKPMVERLMREANNVAIESECKLLVIKD